MGKKSKSYHLDIRANRKNPYGLLRHSYREDGKVKKETICNITGLSLEQLYGSVPASFHSLPVDGSVLRDEDCDE